jgi:hypothetical protein
VKFSPIEEDSGICHSIICGPAVTTYNRSLSVYKKSEVPPLRTKPTPLLESHTNKMELLPKDTQQQANSAQSRKLEVDFSWKKFNTLITEKDDKESKPLYIVGFKVMTSQLVFKSAVDDSTIGTGTLPAISIDSECSIRGQPIKLKAQKRFKIDYEYLSKGFSENEDPVPMTWICDCGFKTWDFICLDRQQMPVAKFSANVWATKKIGGIELLGKATGSEEIRDEIVVTGLTVFYLMVLRSSSIFSFFGAVFSRPGSGEKDRSKNI